MPFPGDHITVLETDLSGNREAMRAAAEAWIAERVKQKHLGKPILLGDGSMMSTAAVAFEEFRHIVEGRHWDPEWFVDLVFADRNLTVRVVKPFDTDRRAVE